MSPIKKCSVRILLLALTCASLAPAARASYQGGGIADAGVLIEVGAGADHVQNFGPRVILQVAAEPWVGSGDTRVLRFLSVQLKAKLGQLPDASDGSALSGFEAEGAFITLSNAQGPRTEARVGGLQGSSFKISLVPAVLQRELSIGVQNKVSVRVVGFEAQKAGEKATPAGHLGIIASAAIQLVGLQYLASQDLLPRHSGQETTGFEPIAAKAQLQAFWDFDAPADAAFYAKRLTAGVRFQSDLALFGADGPDHVSATLVAFKAAARVSTDLFAFGHLHQLYAEGSTLRQYVMSDLNRSSPMPMIVEAGIVSTF